MSNEIAIIAPKNLEESERLSTTLSKSMLLPNGLTGKPSDVLAVVLTGAELGLAPMQAIRGIQIIKGKPTLSADTMGALCKRRRDVCEYLVLKASTAEKAVYETKRVGDPEPTRQEFTIEDARVAGLAGQDNYRKHPKAMLRARCLSAICRTVYPDVVMGLYDPEELGASNTDIAPDPAPQPTEKDITPPVTEKPKTLAEKVHQRRLEIIDVPPEPAPIEQRIHAPDPYGSHKEIEECTVDELKAREKRLLDGVKAKKASTREEAQKKLGSVQAELLRRMVREPGADDEPPMPTDSEIDSSVPF